MVNYKLIVGLICVMLANVLFGSSLAKIKKEFESTTFWNGVYKVIAIVIGAILMCVMAYFTPDILIISINDVNFNMKSAIEMIMTSAIAMYGAMDLKKLAQLIGVSTTIADVVEEGKIEVPEENYIER